MNQLEPRPGPRVKARPGLSPLCVPPGQALPTRSCPAAPGSHLPSSRPGGRGHLSLVTSARLPGFTLIGPSVCSRSNPGTGSHRLVVRFYISTYRWVRESAPKGFRVFFPEGGRTDSGWQQKLMSPLHPKRHRYPCHSRSWSHASSQGTRPSFLSRLLVSLHSLV